MPITIELTPEQVELCRKYAAEHGEPLDTVLSAMRNLLWRKAYNRSPEQRSKRKAYNRRQQNLRSRLNNIL